MANMMNVTCPCCGGSLKFDSQLQKVKCEFCDTEFSVDDLKSYDEELNNKFEEKTEWDESKIDEFSDDENLNLFTCETCGGEVMCDANTTSTRCPYCNNPVLVGKRLVGGLKPQYVIPFAIEKDKAVGNLAKFLRGKVLLPSNFKKDNKVEDISGLYVPYWIFDADVDGNATWNATNVRTWSDSNYNYRETSYYKIIRAGSIGFEHVPVDASQKMPDDLMESIEPFDFRGAKEFSTAYITGYCADKYDVSKETTFLRATERIKEGTVDALRSTITHYSTLSLDSSSISFKSNSAAYAYYPVWTLNTKYREQNFKFVINGQTGKLVGNLPMSVPKYIAWFISMFIIFAALGAGITFGLMSGSEYRIISTIGVGIAAGLLIAFGITFGLKRQLRPVRFQHGAASYVRSGSFGLTNSKDIFLYKTVTRTARPKNNK